MQLVRQQMANSGSISRKNAHAFNLTKLSQSNQKGRAQMFATASKQQIFGNGHGHKTSKSSYENTS